MEMIKCGRSLTYVTLNESISEHSGFYSWLAVSVRTYRTCCTPCSFYVLRGKDNTGSLFVFIYGLLFRAVSILVQRWDDWWLMTWAGVGSNSDAYLGLCRRISVEILAFITRNCRVAYVPTEFRTCTLQIKHQKNYHLKEIGRSSVS